MRLNFRFIGMFLTVSAVLLAGVFVVHYFQTRRSAEEILAAARQARDQGSVAEAVPLYAKYIGLVPESATPRQEVGMLLADVGEGERAFFHLEAALRMDASLTEARKKLVEVAIAMQRYSDAKTHLTSVLIPAEPDNAELVWQLAKCAMGETDLDLAQQHLEKAHQMQPQDWRFAADLARLLSEQRGQPDQARQLLDETIAADETLALSYAARGRWLLEQAAKPRQTNSESLTADAWLDAQKCLELDPADATVVLFVVDAALATGKLDEASAVIERGIQANPKIANMYMKAAEVQLVQGNLLPAIDLLRTGLKELPGQGDLMWNLAQLELDNGKVGAVEPLLRDLRIVQYSEAAIRYLEAATAAQRGQWQAAVARLENSKSLFQSNSELKLKAELLLAKCYQALDNRDEQMAALNRAIGDAPGWSTVRETLAQALLQAGRIPEALVEYRQVMGESNPSVSGLLGLANALFLYHSAREQPDWSELERVLSLLDATPSAANEVSVFKAAMLVGSGENAAAEELLTTELEGQPTQDRLWLALISLRVQDQQWDQVEQDIEQAKQHVEDSLALRMVQASYLIQRYGDEVDVARLEELAEPQPQWNEMQKTQLAASFARAFWTLGDYPRCRKYGVMATSSTTGRVNLSLHLLMFDVGIQQQDEDFISETLKQVNEIVGNGPLWKIGEASRLRVLAAKLGEQDAERKDQLQLQAIEQLSEAAAARPTWARVPAIIGNIYDERDQPENALEQYVKAINLGDKDASLVARTVQLLFQQRRFVQANAVIRKLQEEQATFPVELSRLASQVSLELEDFDQALNLAKQWAPDSELASDHHYLGQVYSIAGKASEAEKEFRRAIELEPSATAAWVSLVQLHARANDLPAAKKVIEEAKQAITGEDRYDAIAQCYQSIGELELAEESFRMALAERPEDAGLQQRFAEFYLKIEKTQQALPLLEKLISQNSAELASVDLKWARRSLALILGLRGEAADSARAEALLNKNLTSADASDDDRRTLAIVLASRSDAAASEQAIKILEELTAGAAQFSIQDNFLLAQILARKQDWTAYRGVMRSVLGNGGANDPVYVAAYVKSLLVQGNVTEAELWMGRLRKLSPAAEPAVDSVEAEYLFLAKDYEGLLKLLQNRATLPNRVGWAAEMAEMFATNLKRQGQSAESLASLLQVAEDGYRQLSDSDPEQAFRLARLYARLSRHAEAAQLITENSYPPTQLAEVIQGALQSDDLDEAASKAYLALVEEACKSHPEHIDLRLGLGDLHSWLGDGEQAAAAYALVLAASPDNIPALNNRAMILALTSQKPTEARQAIELAIAGMGPRDFLLDTRGIVRMAAGDVAGAEEDFRQAIATAPLPDRFFHLAQVLQRQNRVDEARAAFERARAGGVSYQTVHSQERQAFQMLADQFGN